MHDMWHIGCMGGIRLPAAQTDARHAAFVIEYTKCGDALVAAAKVGLSESSGRYLLAQSHIRLAIRAATTQALNEAAPIALKRLRQVAESGADRDAVAAAKTILALSGFVAPKAAAPRGADIPLHEMSLADLRGLSSDLQGELASRATPINTNDAPPMDNDVDIIG